MTAGQILSRQSLRERAGTRRRHARKVLQALAVSLTPNLPNLRLAFDKSRHQRSDNVRLMPEKVMAVLELCLAGTDLCIGDGGVTVSSQKSPASREGAAVYCRGGLRHPLPSQKSPRAPVADGGCHQCVLSPTV